jgi:PPK2 family polyphosphate:nucleotide phosphotransferase
MIKSIDDVFQLCLVSPDKKFKFKNFDTRWAGDPGIPEQDRKLQATQLLAQDVEGLAQAQDLLYASNTWAVLVIIQAIDAAGKDGTIKHVMSGINPQGCQVYSFKQPSSEELDHDFLWRCARALPERGRIGIFNRSYYEEVLVVKVHPEYLAAQNLPDANPGKKSFWEGRYESINNFEKHLVQNGTKIVKVFLNVSRDEQKKRLLERINDPTKNWKFQAQDVAERSHWDAYMDAYAEMLNQTSTEHAPWYVIPADEKWVARPLVAKILTHTIESLYLKHPEVTPQHQQEIAACKQQLENESR